MDGLEGTHERAKLHCRACGRVTEGVGRTLGMCPECVRRGVEPGASLIQALHARSRREFGLPAQAPRREDGLACELCFHHCRMGEEQEGYCGVRRGRAESLRRDGRERALVSYYHDHLPTNCVADWVCPGGTGAGYPRFARTPGPERGFYNLAVFFEACNFNCLYCQNWHFRESRRAGGRWVSTGELAQAAHLRTSCICYFGGDPTPQLPYALAAAEEALAWRPNRILRICWETNGGMHPDWLERMARLSLRTGGCVKVDLKAWHPETHRALCGCDNRRVLANFARLAQLAGERPDPPALVASTLMVPGYVDAEEVGRLASFIAGLNPEIPYALLAFAPQFHLADFPTTSRAQAEACLEAAREAGLTRVRVGNRQLLR